MTPEHQRLRFVEQRDGLAGALAFAKQTRAVYRTCVLRSRKRGFTNPHHASLAEYRRAFIESYLVLKHFIAYHEKLTPVKSALEQ